MRSKVTSVLPVLAALALTAPSQANAQEATTFEDSVPKSIKARDDRFFTLTFENDLFGRGTDQNYTHGTRITYYDAGARSPAFVETFTNLLPFFSINENTSIYYSLGQNLYTPEDLTRTTPDPADRPYAGFLYGAVGLSTIYGDYIEELEITLGIVGPSALGEQTQKTVHDIIAAQDPLGWDAQLEDEPAVILSYQRTWPEAYAADINPLYMRFAPHAGVSLGNVYTHANAGFTVQFTPKKYRWQAPPQRIRPAIPGSGYFVVPEDTFAWSFFAGAEGRAIAHNIFLDGNTFEDSPSVNKKHFVADLSTGITLTYGEIQLAYTLNWRSKEFDGQDDPALFGAVSLGYRF